MALSRIVSDEADVVIVGLGAVGAIAAMVLCERGLSVQAIESGPFMREQEFLQDELANFEYSNALGTKFNRELPWWVEEEGGKVKEPLASIGMMVNAVGGSSIHYGAWSRRFQPADFHSLSSVLSANDATVPSDCSLVDWPITYEDVEPFYGKVEQLLGVAGLAHHPGDRVEQEKGNPFDGRRSGPFPLPPLRPFKLGEMFTRAARRNGYHPYSIPVAILSRDFEGRAACCYCGWCAGYGCRYGSKGSTLVTAVPRALATRNLVVRANAEALRVLVDRGAARGVEYRDETGEIKRVRARCTMLAAYTFENIRLLYLSTTKDHENGLGNGSGQLGRHFMSRQFAEVYGYFPYTGPLGQAEGPAGQAVGFDDFNGENFDHAGLGFVRGGSIAVQNQLQPIRAAKLVPPWIRCWGSRYKEFVIRHWDDVAVLRAQPEPLPYEDNRIDLARECAPDESDLRRPRVRVHYRSRPNELRMKEFLSQRMKELLVDMGAVAVWGYESPLRVLSGHDVGGARMGADAAQSVVDGFGQVHEVAGLYVLGGATFPSASGTNPTLTMQALAWRTADHLLNTLGVDVRDGVG